MEIFIWLLLGLGAVAFGVPTCNLQGSQSATSDEPQDGPMLAPTTNIAESYTLVLVPSKTRRNAPESSCANNELTTNLTEMEIKIDGLLLEISSKDFAIKDLQLNVTNSEEDFKKLNETLNEKEVETRIKTKLAAQVTKIEELEAAVKSSTQAIQSKMSDHESKFEELSRKFEEKEKAVASVVVGHIQIGRWLLEQDNSTEAFLIRDTNGADKRYAFKAGGGSDMYTAGTGGEVYATRIVFPTRWSIDASDRYLVFRDRGVAGRDFRYALNAGVYRDL